jgi:hypothetical protein
MSMLQRFIHRPSHAAVVAYLALFMSTSGTAYAAAKWTSADILDGTLTGVDVSDNSLTGADVAPGSISVTDFAPDALPSGGSSDGGMVSLHTTQHVDWYLGYTYPNDGGSRGPAGPAGPVFASIPGVGDLFVAGCDPERGQGWIGIRNTTDTHLTGFYITKPLGPDGESGTSQALAPGEQTLLYGGGRWIFSGDSPDAPVTYVDHSIAFANGNACRHSAWWKQS